MHGIRGQIALSCMILGFYSLTIPASRADMQLPARGTDKATVETRFGAPQRIEGPIGQPPITKWLYADFIITFEYEHVVHAHTRKLSVEQQTSASTTRNPAATEPAGPTPDIKLPIPTVVQPMVVEELELPTAETATGPSAETAESVPAKPAAAETGGNPNATPEN